ncbi:MAG: BON domain-containing protein [Elusimicrobia bacterium]|nr:BON domain-containing protein [Elusimicrobiota bacterium]
MDTRTVKEQAHDTKVSLAIRKSYYDDKDMSVLAITPYVFLGKAYLVGTYENETQKKKAVSLAKAVEGVDKVVAHLLPHDKKDATCTAAESLRLKLNVKSKLIDDKKIYSTNVEVDAVHCGIVLLGLVTAQHEIERSIKHAKKVKGVRGVKSFLTVHRAPKEPQPLPRPSPQNPQVSQPQKPGT